MNAAGCLLLACTAQGPQVTDLYEPGEEAHWRIEAGNQLIGRHWSRYDGEVELLGVRAHYFEAQVWLKTKTALGEVEQRYAGELWTDAHGLPLRFVLRAALGESYSDVELVFASGEAAAVIHQGSTTRSMKVEVPEGARVLANNFISHFELVLGLEPPPEGEKTKRLFFSASALKPVPVTFAHVGTFETDAAAGVVLRDSLGEEIELADTGRVLSLAANGATFRRTDEPYERFTLEPPAQREEDRGDLVEVDVTIAQGDVRLAGTLSRRKELEGRLPAVFFVSGSGPQDRNGFASGIDLGTHEVLDRLAREGFLVLRVDDRGTGGSTGSMTGTSFDELVADAAACVDFLLEHDGADAEHVFVIGHSEGGETAPLLAARRPQLAGIVLMAPPGRPVIDVIYEQNEAVLRKAGELDEAALAKTMKALRLEMERFCSDAELDPDELDENFRAMLPHRAWFQSHARHDPVADIRKVECPVLIVHGELDFQVSPERDSQPLADALAEEGHPDFELRVLPGLDHLFKPVPGEVSEATHYFQNRRVDAAFLELLASWLEERARK